MYESYLVFSLEPKINNNPKHRSTTIPLPRYSQPCLNPRPDYANDLPKIFFVVLNLYSTDIIFCLSSHAFKPIIITR